MFFSDRIFAEYLELKRQSSDCLLLMQVGAFMQCFDEDAEELSDITGVKLKIGGEADEPHKMAGFPKSGLDKYVGKLVRQGRSVALAMQDEEKNREIKEKIGVELG